MITPNIIVTKKFDTMKRIFFGPQKLGDAKINSLDQVMQNIREEEFDTDFLICAPGKNPNLIEADLNIPANANARGYLNLKFIETNEILEYFLLTTKPIDTYLNSAFELLAKANIPLGSSLKQLNKFYVSFGTGDDLGEWAGPFEVSLGAAQVDLDKNVKVITLGFLMGSLQGIKAYTKKFHGALGFADGDKMNPPLSRGSKVKLNASVWMSKGLKPTKGPRTTRDPSRKRCLLPPYGWNTYIRHLLRRYLGQVYGDPYRIMIILGDDMDKIFNDPLTGSESKDFCRNYQGKLKEFGITLGLKKPDASNKGEKTSRGGGPPEVVTVGGKDVTIDGQFNVDDLAASRLRMDQRHRGPEYKEYSSNQERSGSTQAIQEKMTEYKELWDSDYLLTECYISMGMKIDVNPSVKTPESALDPIFEFLGALRKNQLRSTTYGLFEINDVEINDFINQSCGGPMHEHKTSRLVFGDVDLIKRLIYLSDEGKTKPSNETAYKKAFSDEALDDIDWESYQKKFKDTILLRERRQTSSFKEKLDFGPFTKEFKEIEDQKDIIFMHGVRNSNVISVNFKKDFAQGELMSYEMESIRRNPYLNNFTQLAVIDDTFNIKQLIEYLDTKKIFVDDLDQSRFNLAKWIEDQETADSEEFKEYRSRVEATDAKIINQSLVSKDERFADYIDLIIGYKKLLKSDYRDGLQVEVPYTDDNIADGKSRILATMADLFEKVQKKIIGLQIKTLPFFNQKAYFNRECYFFSLYNNIISSSRDNSDKIPSTFLNGNYITHGSRHFMSANNAFSEFVLAKPGNPGEDPILSKTRELITGESSEETKSKKPRATSGPNKATLPKEGKRQAIANRLQMQIFNSNTGEAIPGTVLQ